MARSIEFEGPNGEALFRIEVRGETVRIEGPEDDGLLSMRLLGERFAIDAPDGNNSGFVEPPSERHRGFVIFAADRTEPLLELRFEPDGDLKVADAEGRIVYEAKARDYGFKIVDEAGRLESKIRVRDGKVSIRDASGTTYMSTRDSISAAAAAALSMGDLRFEHAVALSVAISHWNTVGRGDPDQPRSNFSSR